MRHLMQLSDLFRAAIVGNLMDYEVCSTNGEWTQGKRFKFQGRVGAYVALPSENVVFCECHDNETLFDYVI